MAFTPEVFRHRARRAYELGRVRVAVPWSILIAAVGLLSSRLTGAGAFGVSMALLSAAIAAFCVWYGREPGRGVFPGLWVGTVAMSLALVAWVCGARGGGGFVECQLPCVLAGLLISAGAAHNARRTAGPRVVPATLLATVAIATPLTLIACVGAGVGALVGLAIGLAVGGAPAVVSLLRADR